MAREIYFDLLKFLAIFLVVIGHCIQRSYMAFNLNTEDFYSDIVFKFIYGFHLPLFMTISGFFFYGTVCKYDFWTVVKSRFTRLVVPIIVWHSIWMVTDGFSNRGAGYTIRSFIFDFLTHYWFLWALFFCSLGILVMRRLFGESLKIYVFIFPLLLFLPNMLNICRYVYLFPYFLFGYAINKHNLSFVNKEATMFKDYKMLLLGGALMGIYIALMSHFAYEHYIYTSGTCLINMGYFSFNQLKIDLVRYLVGFIGIGFLCTFLLMTKDFFKPGIVNNIGEKTLGIYIIHMFFTPFISEFQISVNYLLIIIEAIGLILLSYVITLFLEKQSYLKFLLGR